MVMEVTYLHSRRMIEDGKQLDKSGDDDVNLDEYDDQDKNDDEDDEDSLGVSQGSQRARVPGMHQGLKGDSHIIIDGITIIIFAITTHVHQYINGCNQSEPIHLMLIL